jgi:PPK2 family polyphosphate:nucleotide phosphotransferase
MNLSRQLIDELRVAPNVPAALADRSTTETHADWRDSGGTSKSEKSAGLDLEAFTHELATGQELLYATGAYALLVVLQGLDASGKDGTVKHVMSGVNPQGCEVTSFKAPTPEELEHDFLWRCAKVLPARGRIGVFNRSYYEEVLVARVHPEILAAQHLAPDSASEGALWDERFEDINAFEQHLHRNGTRIVKVFLHISKDEQRKRLLARLDDPSKNWKFSESDLAERAFFDDYQQAYESMLSATSTPWAPWYVVPADHKPVARALVGGILTDAIAEMDLRLPKVTDEGRKAISAAKKALRAD